MAMHAPITGTPLRAPVSYQPRPATTHAKPGAVELHAARAAHIERIDAADKRQPSSRAQELTFARENIEWAARQVRPAGEPTLEAALVAIAARIANMGLPAVQALGCERCGGDVPADQPRCRGERLCAPCVAEVNASRRRKPAVAASLGATLERMIATQMTIYPTDWSDADKRELAEHHLFGEAARG